MQYIYIVYLTYPRQKHNTNIKHKMSKHLKTLIKSPILPGKYIEDWSPKAGWNPSLTFQERAYATNIYLHLHRNKHFTPTHAETIAMAFTYKRRSAHIRYNDELESLILEVKASFPK